jgi:prepilin-type N-terminal cleavage/methylation domain-containing protein
MNRSRPGFTLFEVILAIALSATLLTLIGTAINLYLTRVEASRVRVEEAQLARSVLSMIADDIRATSIYQPQDTSEISKLMAKSTSFNVDSLDQANPSSSGASGISGLSAGSNASSLGGVSSSLSQSSSGSHADGSSTELMPLGINGSQEELYVDATRLPKQEELFASATGYTNAPSPKANGAVGATSPTGGVSSINGGTPAADLKTVHYFVRPGEALEAGSVGATSLAPDVQQAAGGLVRQEVSRSAYVYAEQNGGSDVMNSNATLIAPEVVHIEFRYFNGDILTEWNMTEEKTLPKAVEVCIWVRSGKSSDQPVSSNYDAASLADSTRQYKQVVYLPASQLASNSQSSSTSETDSSGSSTDNSSDSTQTGSGSSFD